MKIMTLPFIVLLVGCVANGLPQGVHRSTPSNAIEETTKMFVGVPTLLALEGSSAKYNNEWRITAAHNKAILIAQNKEFYIHPTCDVALYRERSKGVVIHGLVYPDEAIYHVGYPIGLPIASHIGRYLEEVLNTDDGCIYSASTSVVISGMSGGGVYNRKGELVGINIGIAKNSTIDLTDKTLFLPLKRVEGWITETINKY